MNTFMIEASKLTPHEANIKARPAERPEQRAKRVAELQASIDANGQQYPVLVVAANTEEFDDDGNPVTRYEYIDGGARVEAMLPDGLVECIGALDTDLYRTALITNMHRSQNTVMDMALIVADVRERQGWKGRGAGKKVAEYLGIQESRVSEYDKVYRAPKATRDLIQNGDITSLDAALKILAIKPEEQPRVLEVAKEIAKAEDDARATDELPEQPEVEETEVASDEPAEPFESEEPEPAKGKGNRLTDEELAERKRKTDAAYAASRKKLGKENKPKATTKKGIQAKHVVAAAKQVNATTAKPKPASTKIKPKTRTELVEFFNDLRALKYPAAAKEFIRFFVDEFAPGKADEHLCLFKFDAAVGAGVAGTTVPVEPAVPTAMAVSEVPSLTEQAKAARAEVTSRKPKTAEKTSKKSKKTGDCLSQSHDGFFNGKGDYGIDDEDGPF